MSHSFTQSQWQDYLGSMSKTLIHRGPDDDGLWFDAESGIGFVQRRLSIVDLSPLGHQPMFSQSGRYAIVFNGEIYNFKQLRAECEKAGAKFRGNCDTEVILASVELWGLEASAKKFVGMFAIALWDKQDHTLFLCRDRIGKKPLYYGTINGAFIFASELKAICALPFFNRETDRNVLALLVQYNAIPSPYSIYKNVFKVAPGTIVEIKAAYSLFTINTTQYWSLSDVAEYGQKNLFSPSENEIVNNLDDLLTDATKIRMIADVPLGAFLSGGIDSSTIVALMQKQSARPVKTFSIGNNDAKYDEAIYAKKVAAHLGTDHTEFYVTPKDIADVIPLLPQMFDEPLPDSSQIPTYLVSKLSRSHVTVALTGDAGDEVFGGYSRYTRIPAVWNALSVFPMPLRKMAEALLSHPSFITQPAINALVSLLRKKGRVCNSEEIYSYMTRILSVGTQTGLFQRYLSNENMAQEVVLHSQEIPSILSSPAQWPMFKNFENTMMFVDMLHYLVEDILVKVDRASMAVSLETRTPLLDHRVVEFAWKLPLKYKIRGNQSKWILRQVLYKYVPKDLVDRPKMGFSIPVGKWLKNELRPWAESLLNENRLKSEGYFNPEAIQKKWRAHISGDRDWHFYLWNILTFQAWLEAKR